MALSKTTTASLAGVVALALTGGAYAGWNAVTVTPAQNIISGVASLQFQDDMTTRTFASSYRNMTSGDVMYTAVDLKNSGTVKLNQFTLKATATGSADFIGLTNEGLDVLVENVSDPGVDAEWGTADDVVTGSALAQTKVGSLGTAVPLDLMPSYMVPNDVKHLRFKVSIPQAAVLKAQEANINWVVGATSTTTNSVAPQYKDGFLVEQSVSGYGSIQPQALNVGETATWTVDVTNRSDADFSDVVASGAGLTIATPSIGVLAKSNKKTLTVTVVATQTDLEANPLSKELTLTATKVGGGTTVTKVNLIANTEAP